MTRARTMIPPERPRSLTAALLAAIVAAGAAFAADPPPPVQSSQSSAPSVGTAPAVRPVPAPVRVAQAGTAESKPGWNELTQPQKQALAPLAGSWATLSEAHKRKWLALADSYPTMPPGEQARVHTRMAEWAALSPQQRNQARMNFAETQRLPAADDRKAKWEAYQALPAEEKRKLAADGKPLAPPTAAAVKPVPQQKLARVPKAGKDDSSRTPRIAVVPDQPMEPNSFAPQPAPVLP